MAFVVDSLLQLPLIERLDEYYYSHGFVLGSGLKEEEINNRSSSSESEEHDTVSAYPGILDTELTALSATERAVFMTLATTLLVLSLSGNIGTLHVNVHRKMRPFFRACLISLALGDLLNTVLLASTYLAQFSVQYVQIWLLGSTMCNVVPYATTAAILASSSTLLCIALDRYFAMRRAATGFRNPGVVVSALWMSGIWAVSFALSSPVIWMYSTIRVYILEGIDMESSRHTTLHPIMVIHGRTKGTTESLDDEPVEMTTTTDFPYTLVKEQRLVTMCVSGQENLSLFYVVVFGLIFVPCIVAFVWLNSIIAKKLWLRRHTATSAPCVHVQAAAAAAATKTPKRRPAMCNCRQRGAPPTSVTMPSSMARTMGAASPSDAAKAPPSTASGTRESRHIRMFTIIVLMMAVFIFFRLPAWIFLVMRTYSSYTDPTEWIVHFSFGILNLTSCVLNPLFYTFLPETIEYALHVKAKLCCCCCGPRGAASAVSCGRRLWAWLMGGGDARRAEQLLEAPLQPPMAYVLHAKRQPSVPVNAEQDEGVVCSDVSDEEGSCSGAGCKEAGDGDFYDYSQRIYTIFPPSMVSSSVAEMGGA